MPLRLVRQDVSTDGFIWMSVSLPTLPGNLLRVLCGFSALPLGQWYHPQFDMLERICPVEPRISAEYLLRGEGDSLGTVSTPAALNTVQQLREFKLHSNEFIENKGKELGG